MHKFSDGELSSYLASKIAGFGRITSVERFKAGQSNPTYLIDTSEGRFVMRAKPPGKLLKGAHAVDREFRVLSALANTDVPVPAVFHLSEDDSPIGTQFYVMDFVEGRILWDPALPDADDRAGIYDAMNQTLVALHKVDPEAVGLSDFGRPGNYFARQLTTWGKAYKAAETDPLPAADWLFDWLTEHMPEDDGLSCITHGDYRLDNMVFDAEAPTVKALLDWELSTLGHPFADLAYQMMMWGVPNSGRFKGLGGIDRAALGLPSNEAYAALYLERTGFKAPQSWSFYLAFMHFRFLAILQGVLARALQGNAANPMGHQEMRMAVEWLAMAGKSEASRAA